MEAASQLYGDQQDEAPLFTDSTADSQNEKSRSKGRERGFWQLHNRYILTQTRTGFTVIDQHAAHKRIIYEKALSATEETLPGTQQLLLPRQWSFLPQISLFSRSCCPSFSGWVSAFRPSVGIQR